MSKTTALCVLVCVLVLSSITVLAEDEVYFTAALWDVPRAKWPAYVDEAFEAAWGGLSEIDRKARQALFREATEAGSHRDQMNRIIHRQAK